MTLWKAMLFTPAAALCLSACGEAAPEDVDASLKSATVAAIPGADASGITISAAERHTAKWTWTATFGGTAYKCDADEHMRLPSCAAQSPAGEA